MFRTPAIHTLDARVPVFHTRLMRVLVFLLLAACTATPSPLMMGAQKTQVAANGREYIVWHSETRVEITRLGWASPGEHQQIRADMITLIEQVTGCTLNEASLTGDSGQMRASIRC